MIGTTRKGSAVSADNGKACLLRFDGRKTTNHLINNIIASNQSGCYSVWADSTPTLNLVSNKLSDTSLTTATVNQSGTNSTGFTGSSSSFGGLQWTAGTSVTDSYWLWNGTLTEGVNKEKSSLADVKTAIQGADADFYAWLNSIGALDKDARGENRNATTWPGAYEN
jgi:hypothetical protein